MKDKPLYLVVGKSGSGKTYIIEEKINKEFGTSQVYSRTTRLPRYLKENGHIFVDSQQADKEWNRALAKTVYNNDRYYTLLEDIENVEFYVIDPNGVRNFQHNKVNRPIVKIYINSNWLIRFIHMLKRGDEIKNIIKRLRVDRKEFKGFEDVADITFKNSNEMYRYFREKFRCEKMIERGRTKESEGDE
ncbi:MULTISPECIES: hypothetical protein [unclassified Clostridium]|uniref:hypothetical protein n=1 Tax=unclassified Clostridium TaxID=2614128 RepID=UPI002079D543|nr:MULTISPECIES: hypothetical protein [unclassified Clostridium]